ncbi:MAG: mechanosensitive ion channel family protein [Rhodospirillales bacterium]
MAPAGTTAEVSMGDLEALVATIEDEAGRKRLVARIRALIAAQKGVTEEPAVESLGAGFIDRLSENVKKSSGRLAAAVQTLSDLPGLAAWLRAQAGDPDARALWQGLLFKLALVLAVGWGAQRLVRFLLGRTRRALEGRDTDSLLVRIPVLAGRTVLDVVPIAAFAGAAYGALPLTQPGPEVYVVALTVINAYLIVRATLVVARMLLVPAVPSLRVLPIGGETANYLFIWTRRLVWVTVAGYFLAEAALLLGLPAGGHAGLLHLLGLLVTGMVVVFVLQNRAAVAGWVRGAADAGPGRFGVRTLRARFADIWHVPAIIYVAGVYGVWALGVEGGFQFMARATIATAAILTVAGLAAYGLRRGVRRGFAVKEEVKTRFPTLEARANRYLPVLHVGLRWVIYAVAALAVLQAWGIDTFGWLETPFGRRLTESTLSIVTVTVLALIVWEAISSAIERYLTRTDADGTRVERSARARTLLPLLRNAVLVVLTVMVSMIVLSELGVDIAPLLAGAGVVGLAIGFGAQKLVQDVITGAFILFEDSIAVGDVVDVGGLAGVVEALSIRSIRLRDLSGKVHTVPFSAVDTVTNMTKDFSYYVFEVGVGYREDTDEVTGVLKEIGAEMQDDPEFGPLILAPFEVLGVDQFADSAVIIKARFKTAPIKQWTVGREFNRRMKQRFDELGIEIPFPHTTIYFGEDKHGEAPPARIRTEEAAAAPRRAARPKKRRKRAAADVVELPASEDGADDGV